MKPRLNPWTAAPQLMQQMVEYSQSVAGAGLERSLVELVKVRSSQINGCAICLHMHTEEARRQGETEERLYMLDAWSESPLFSERERAALGWTEALTRLAETHAPDAAYDALKAQFSDEEQVKLTLMINVINSFNRVGVGFRLSHPMSGAKGAAA
jgi:AhpD family alkylhydroperoxidase